MKPLHLKSFFLPIFALKSTISRCKSPVTQIFTYVVTLASTFLTEKKIVLAFSLNYMLISDFRSPSKQFFFWIIQDNCNSQCFPTI